MQWNDPQCRGLGHLFFPVARETAEERRARQAVAMELCDGCPDRDACLELGIKEEVERPEDDRHAPGGVWGGRNRRGLLRLARERASVM